MKLAGRWITVRFDPRDIWIGVYWTTKPASYGTEIGKVNSELHIYVCLLPCFPIHFIKSIYFVKWSEHN